MTKQHSCFYSKIKCIFLIFKFYDFRLSIGILTMALNIKTEVFGLEESNSIVHLSTDEDDCEIENNLHVPEGKPPERPRTPETHCSICLEELSNRFYTDSCWHMFCFECLKRWSTVSLLHLIQFILV